MNCQQILEAEIWTKYWDSLKETWNMLFAPLGHCLASFTLFLLYFILAFIGFFHFALFKKPERTINSQFKYI